MKKYFGIFALICFLGILISGCRDREKNRRYKLLNDHSWKIKRYNVNGIDSTAEKNQIFYNLPLDFYTDDDHDRHYIGVDEVTIGKFDLNPDDVLNVGMFINQNSILSKYANDSSFVNHLKLLNGSYQVITISENQFNIRKTAPQMVIIEMQAKK